MHGHTNLSDGAPDIDTYFTNIRDLARLDFAVLTDHYYIRAELADGRFGWTSPIWVEER